MAKSSQQLTAKQKEELQQLLKKRFEKNMQRHKGLQWDSVQKKIDAAPAKLFSLHQMESTGGEPDVVAFDKKTGEFIFFDCSPETPTGRRSLCFDREALDARKEHKPKDNALDMAKAMGIDLLTEDEYRYLQQLGTFDAKTSSWIQTPAEIRKLGGALFGDFRYGRVFFYHNGAQSYYAARGFRGSLRV